MKAVLIHLRGRVYGAKAMPAGVTVLTGKRGDAATVKTACFDDEETARRWFGDHGLRRGKARALLAAALRGEGALAGAHPSRV